MCTSHLILDLGFMLIKTWKMPALLTSLSLLFSEPGWYHCTPISWTCVWCDSRLSCPCRSPPGGGPQKWFLNCVPCSLQSRVQSKASGCGLVIPTSCHTCSPQAWLWVYWVLDKICLKTGCGCLRIFFFLKLFWKPSVNQKCWGLPLLLPYQCVWETLLSLSSFSLLMCNMMALAQMP